MKLTGVFFDSFFESKKEFFHLRFIFSAVLVGFLLDFGRKYPCINYQNVIYFYVIFAPKKIDVKKNKNQTK